MNEKYELIDLGRASETTQSLVEGPDDAGNLQQNPPGPAI